MSEVYVDVSLVNDEGNVIDLFTFYKIFDDVYVGMGINLDDKVLYVDRYDEVNDEYWIDELVFTDARMWKCAIGSFLSNYWYKGG